MSRHDQLVAEADAEDGDVTAELVEDGAAHADADGETSMAMLAKREGRTEAKDLFFMEVARISCRFELAAYPGNSPRIVSSWLNPVGQASLLRLAWYISVPFAAMAR